MHGRVLSLNSRKRGKISHLINPLTARVVWAPQMISQPVSSIFSCFPLLFGTWRTPGLSNPWCCLPTCPSVCLSFFPLSLCLARWFWPDLMNRRHDHTTAVCVFLRSSGDLHVVRLPAGSWHGLGRCMPQLSGQYTGSTHLRSIKKKKKENRRRRRRKMKTEKGREKVRVK